MNDYDLSIDFATNQTNREIFENLLKTNSLKKYAVELATGEHLIFVEYKDYKKKIELICKIIRYAYGTDMILGEFKELFNLATNKEFDVKKNLEEQLEVFRNENT